MDAGTGAALLVDRVAYEAAGGLAAIDDLDAAAVELCARLRARGGRVVLVPGAVVVDHRPVRARRELRHGGRPERSGLGCRHRSVRRRAAPGGGPAARAAAAVCPHGGGPSAKVAARWGDWHLAQALADSLRRLGHEVRLQTADQADSLAGRACDVHVVLRGLHPVRRSAGAAPRAVDHQPPRGDRRRASSSAADLVLVASPRFADHLRDRTDTPVDVLLQATDHRRFAPRPVDPAHRHDVTIVAKTRDVLRPVVADALAAGLRPRIYGGGWRGLVDPATDRGRPRRQRGAADRVLLGRRRAQRPLAHDAGVGLRVQPALRRAGVRHPGDLRSRGRHGRAVRRRRARVPHARRAAGTGRRGAGRPGACPTAGRARPRSGPGQPHLRPPRPTSCSTA